MNITKIINELLKERQDLDMAIAAVGELAARKRGPGRPPKLFGTGSRRSGARRGPGRPPGRTMSAAARAKISAAQRKRWAKAKSAAK
jgi:hypothetical protein